MTPTIRTAANPTAIDATRILLSQTGITATDLLTTTPRFPPSVR
ncbi:hypothetical protein OG563_38005 [Nocardia vinacea]|uniref:Uncharacterized protein n=1 Tax=Nocardia vinacea TaxID=96468 RepID=A0ABZ1YNT5_9NOCA|nr:hypothetical protein [Nocardia vinacea]